METKRHLDDCPIQPVVDIISGKWTAYVLWEIYNGNNHYGSMARALPGISSRTLSTRLKMLESRGIITRTIFDTNPPTVAYKLTNKGNELAPILISMKEWSERFKNGD
ncbi:winged helix-turn-helix transcriptional regulator [Fructilactobacillus carniphilus]|uniref:Helix-turn-helix transcriptional regulator n=1 Tax=Fructilactobacillus carniphilus TaxID=2940297 RepID=A0ABY5BWE3_9LACO|nr:helix-turn-helix domain-containing protein [Fructilactobacillus carniphilus]USS90819.1 helix-turn-helix transcriptional regulator [Fructilactobacillus carniphilus]